MDKRAQELGFRIGSKGTKSTLSDKARELLPVPWMKKFIPDLLKTVGKSHGGSLHSATNASPNQFTSSLALALMFDSAGEAIVLKAQRLLSMNANGNSVPTPAVHGSDGSAAGIWAEQSPCAIAGRQQVCWLLISE